MLLVLYTSYPERQGQATVVQVRYAQGHLTQEFEI